jgi:hypothetical protein
LKEPGAFDVLTVLRPPGRLTSEQVAQWLGFGLEDIRVLMRAGLLRPLGSPLAHNAVKYFAAVEISELAQDRAFLDRATKVISREIREKNHR